MGSVSTYLKTPMDGVAEEESLPEFLKSAGEKGWLLCGVMEGYISPTTTTIHPNPQAFAKLGGEAQRTLQDLKEVIELVFVRET
jgi:hypothetical protein